MNFDDKFHYVTPSRHIDYGDSSIFKSKLLKRCVQCGISTYWRDAIMNVHLCSEECFKARWDKFFEEERGSL